MNKLLILIFVILLGIQAQAQKTNLIFFTEQAERFYLVLNGIQQNADLQTNVMVTDLPAPSYKLKIIFEDTRLELAKYAYGYTYDIGNYYQLNDAFTFESSIEELNEYINSFRW